YFEHPSYVPLLLRAYELWHELETRSGSSLLMLPGGLMMGPPGSAVVAGSIRSTCYHNLAHEVLDAPAIRRRFPQFSINDNTLALFEKASGLVWCERSVAAHLNLAAISGAELHFAEPIIRWEVSPNGEGGIVRTTRAAYQAGHLIITTRP